MSTSKLASYTLTYLKQSTKNWIRDWTSILKDQNTSTSNMHYAWKRKNFDSKRQTTSPPNPWPHFKCQKSCSRH
jgi:hypothetical protein